MAQSPAPSPAPPPVEDPYRHFEDLADPRTQAFFREQGARAREALDAIPGRKPLLERIRALSAAETTVTALKLGGTRVFYLKLAPGRDSAALYVREGLAGAERLLLEPQSFARGTRVAAIEGFSPSPDGRHVAVGMSEAGAVPVSLRVLAVDGARPLPFEIDRARDPDDIAWHPDGRSFFYARAPEEEGGGGRSGVRLYRHVLGRATDRDEVVFAPGVGGARDVPRNLVASLHLPIESRYAYALAREGTAREVAVHVAELRDLDEGKPRWRKLAGVEDEVLAILGSRGEIYALSRFKAPRHRVLRVKSDAPGMIGARVVVPEGESVIQSMALARDALYLRTMVGGVDRLERVPLGLLGARAPEFVRIPFDNAISQLIAHPRAEGALLRLQGWIEPPALLQVDRRGELQRLALQPKAAASFADMDEVRLYANSHDGTRIPVTLVYAKATRLTGENPTLLSVYGAYGESVAPAFDAAQLAWLERGGVLAFAHVRGGGEFGAGWHAAGRGAAKVNTILDTIAAAQFVSTYGFTSPHRLVLMGTGAGGIAVAGALVRRPELVAAAALRAPMIDMVRAEQGPGGSASVTEFGSAAAASELEALRAISAYHQLDDARSYPPMLLSVGMNDGRVDAWHAAKLTARLPPARVLLRADFEAGHPPAASRAQRDEEMVDVFTFALWRMGEPGFQPPPPPAPPAPPPPHEPAPPATATLPAEPPAPVQVPASGDPRNPNPERPRSPP